MAWTPFFLTYLSSAPFATRLGEFGEDEAQTCMSSRLQQLLHFLQGLVERKKLKFRRLVKCSLEDVCCKPLPLFSLRTGTHKRPSLTYSKHRQILWRSLKFIGQQFVGTFYYSYTLYDMVYTIQHFFVCFGYFFNQFERFLRL